MTDEEQHKVITDKLTEILDILKGKDGKTGLCAKVNILWGSGGVIVITTIATLVKAFWK